MKKIVLNYFSISLVVILLVACSRTENLKVGVGNNSYKKNKVSIKWLAQWYGEGNKEVLVREIARDFSFLNQDIDLTFEFPFQMLNIDPNKPSFSGTRDSIAKMITTNTWPYDIMLCDAYIYQQIGGLINDNNWGQKYLVDFRNEDWFIQSHKDILFENDIPFTNYGGIAPGAYIEGVWDLLYVSSAAEEKLGIKIKDYDMTVDDFIEYAKAVYNYNQNHSDKITFFSTQWYGGTDYLFNQLVMSQLGKNYNNVTTDPFQVLLEVYQKLEPIAKYNPLQQNTTFSGERELKQDKILFNFSYSWVFMFWIQNNPDGVKKMRPCELPSMTGKTARSYPGKYNAVFVIPKNARNKDAAIKLMKFISSGDIAYKWEKYSKCPTGLKSRAAFNEFGSDDFNKFSLHMDRKYNNRLEEVNLSNILFSTNKSIDFGIGSLLRGERNAEETLEFVKSQF